MNIKKQLNDLISTYSVATDVTSGFVYFFTSW